MPDRSILLGVALIATLILSLSAHEAAHALVASWRGDQGPKERGRITLNPLRHLHPVLSVLLPAFLWFGLPWISSQVPGMAAIPPILFGGARPVMVDRTQFQRPHRDMMGVALAGPVTNFLIAIGALVALQILLKTGHRSSEFGLELLVQVVKWNLILGLFNMFPIPPLDGSRVAAWLLPPPLRGPFGALDVIGLPLVIGIFFFVPPVQRFMATATYETYDALARWVRDAVGLFLGSGG